MKVSHSWLQSYFKDTLPNPDELAEVLTTHAFEIEGVEGDIIDVDVLPNRAHDSLSHNGIAREVGVLLSTEVIFPEVVAKTKRGLKSSDYITLAIEKGTPVRRAMKRMVQNVSITPSPDWLKERLEGLGHKSINNVVDVTNLVMLETGQPVHAFDLDKLAGDTKKITVRNAHDGEVVTTLDGDEFTLTSEDMVIADDEKALDIAGVKGGINSGIDENTKHVVLSVCNFDPITIRKTSQRLGLRTDASTRFENDITPERTLSAIERLSQLIAELAGGEVSEDIFDEYIDTISDWKVDVSVERTNQLLGTNLSGSDISEILDRFSFSYEENSNVFTVTIPNERLDLTIEEDLIEEIGRVYGYENIEPTPVDGSVKSQVNKTFYYTQKIRDILVNEGFYEVMMYSFSGEGDIELQNPLTQGREYLRTSLVSGLKDALESNERNKDLFGADSLKLFEIGKVFTKSDGEFLALGIAADDITSTQQALEDIGLTINSDSKGTVIEINLDEWILNQPEPNNSDDLENIDTTDTKFEMFSQYPFVLRDIALWTPSGTKADEPQGLIVSTAGNLLVGIRLFDEFEKEDRVSYAYRLVFQSHEKTLTDSEVNERMEAVEKAVTDKGWEVR